MCAKQSEVCEKFRKLKITKKTGLCLGFFSLNETPENRKMPVPTSCDTGVSFASGERSEGDGFPSEIREKGD
jgi:hypothetical protein